jgi:hypothetical protein
MRGINRERICWWARWRRRVSQICDRRGTVVPRPPAPAGRSPPTGGGAAAGHGTVRRRSLRASSTGCLRRSQHGEGRDPWRSRGEVLASRCTFPGLGSSRRAGGVVPASNNTIRGKVNSATTGSAVRTDFPPVSTMPDGSSSEAPVIRPGPSTWSSPKGPLRTCVLDGRATGRWGACRGLPRIGLGQFRSAIPEALAKARRIGSGLSLEPSRVGSSPSRSSSGDRLRSIRRRITVRATVSNSRGRIQSGSNLGVTTGA